jgi:hypothetical protein
MTDTQRQHPRPLGVSEATRLREIDLWREHERVANELGMLQRRSHAGHLSAADATRHRNLILQLDAIEIGIAALEVEQGAEQSAALARFTGELQADIERMAKARPFRGAA